ncbi:MAG: response regulator [Gammaproteobacteria bacterium]|nr:response regulator [Gammaproteobacteria bacterium]
MSTGSVRNYVLTDEEKSDPNKLYLINSDNDKAVSYWVKKYLGSDKLPSVATVFAGKRKINGARLYNLKMPFLASQVISTFDAVTINEMNFIPELTIGEVMDETALSHSYLENIIDRNSNGKNLFKALVVDDSQPVRKQLEIELKLLGAEVEAAFDGKKAIELCRDNEYDIIFLDVVMPGMDGYKVCKFLKKNTQTKHTPVIMLTGKSSPFDKVKGTLSGCDSYLIKPLKREQFENIARKYIPDLNETQRM